MLAHSTALIPHSCTPAAFDPPQRPDTLLHPHPAAMIPQTFLLLLFHLGDLARVPAHRMLQPCWSAA